MPVSDLDKIRDQADALTDPHINREPYTVWDGQRHRKIHHHITVQHGLLAQLYRAVQPATSNTDEPGTAIPASRPPLEVEALSRHQQISTTTARWCTDLGLQTRVSAESNIRALVGAAANLDLGQQKALLADLHRWTGWCRVYLGLEQVRRIPGVRCPLPTCNTLGTLRINLTTSHGLCTACGATWDRDSIGVLAEHIKTNRPRAAAKADNEGSAA
jgi:hypothetical protein